jgi:hypothetical protein
MARLCKAVLNRWFQFRIAVRSDGNEYRHQNSLLEFALTANHHVYNLKLKHEQTRCLLQFAAIGKTRYADATVDSVFTLWGQSVRVNESATLACGLPTPA